MSDNIKIFGLEGSGALTVVMVGGFGLIFISKWFPSEYSNDYEVFGFIMIIFAFIGLLISAGVDIYRRNRF